MCDSVQFAYFPNEFGLIFIYFAYMPHLQLIYISWLESTLNILTSLFGDESIEMDRCNIQNIIINSSGDGGGCSVDDDDNDNNYCDCC